METSSSKPIFATIVVVIILAIGVIVDIQQAASENYQSLSVQYNTSDNEGPSFTVVITSSPKASEQLYGWLEKEESADSGSGPIEGVKKVKTDETFSGSDCSGTVDANGYSYRYGVYSPGSPLETGKILCTSAGGFSPEGVKQSMLTPQAKT